MSQSKINKLCYFKLNPDGTYSRSSTCQIKYNKISTAGNDPSISQKMRYAQYIRNATAKPKEPLRLVETDGTIITYWRTDFFVDASGNAFLSKLLKHIPDYQFYNFSPNGVATNIVGLINIFFEADGLETAGKYSFSKSNIQTINFPNTLYFIDNNAFESCSDLTSINLSRSLNTINPFTFNNCINLTSVQNISNIVNILEYAFANCSNLTTLDVIDSIFLIDKHAFENCSKLTNIDLTSLSIIGESAFQNCSLLNNINLQNIRNISDNCFNNCSSLSNITFSMFLNSIGISSFKNCSSLEYLVLPDNLNTIGNNAFENSGLFDISFSQNLENISDFCFYNCSNLTYLYITPNIKQIGNNSFENCINLQSILIENNNNLNAINNYAFYNCSKLNSLLNFNNLKSIGEYAFSNCNSLIDIDISANTISNHAFFNCNYLETVKIGQGIQYLDSSTFQNCYFLNDITFNGQIENIGESCFRNCSFLKNIFIPYVTEIQKNAFESCTSLLTVDLSNVIQIREKAFYNCRQLQSISNPTKLNFIGNNAFYNNRFKKFFFPPTLKIINQYSFNRCNLVEEFEFDNNSVEIIQSYAFQNCSSLNHLLLPDSLLFINSFAFFNNTSLKEVYLRQSVADNINVTHGFDKPFYGAITNITIIDDLPKPLHITHENIIINGEKAVLNKIYLYFENNINYLLANNISINITEGSIINNSNYPSFFTLDGSQPIYIPMQYSNMNNLSNQIWFNKNINVPSNTYFQIAQFVTTYKTFGNVKYTYSDPNRNDYLEYNLKFIYGKLLNYKYIPPTITYTYTNVSLPLHVEYENIVIDNNSYVLNKIYLLFSSVKTIYSHTINTNINGTVYLDNNNLDKSTYLTVDSNTPYQIPNVITNWNNLNNQIWFYPNYQSTPNNKFMIMQFTLSSNSNGNFNYIYSDITKSDYNNYYLTITNGYIGGFD